MVQNAMVQKLASELAGLGADELTRVWVKLRCLPPFSNPTPSNLPTLPPFQSSSPATLHPSNPPNPLQPSNPAPSNPPTSPLQPSNPVPSNLPRFSSPSHYASNPPPLLSLKPQPAGPSRKTLLKFKLLNLKPKTLRP